MANSSGMVVRGSMRISKQAGSLGSKKVKAERGRRGENRNKKPDSAWTPPPFYNKPDRRHSFQELKPPVPGSKAQRQNRPATSAITTQCKSTTCKPKLIGFGPMCVAAYRRDALGLSLL
ncbi:hypothetical protein EYF80_018697 [Liparis tanakae]|uniref:Uncharacterized protein n=1 Tax=Liparis tanakae TaxID=230148 RepID=A0A4Z2HZ20_9TELE|nr:hypothetical protein EYF80_018697 [Liparis tanakae]